MTERLLPSTNTLVKYDNPILVTKHEPPTTSGEVCIFFVISCSTFLFVAPYTQGDADSKNIAGVAVAAEQKHETEEILNTILPPKEWEEDGQLWRQEVSTTPATRLDVVNLQEQLDMRLQQRQVYSQFFHHFAAFHIYMKYLRQTTLSLSLKEIITNLIFYKNFGKTVNYGKFSFTNDLRIL